VRTVAAHEVDMYSLTAFARTHEDNPTSQSIMLDDEYLRLEVFGQVSHGAYSEYAIITPSSG